MRQGFFVIEIHARTPADERWVCRVEAQGDPGYGATSVMLGESGWRSGSTATGCPTAPACSRPATGIGLGLADRLRAAGQTFEATRAGTA